MQSLHRHFGPLAPLVAFYAASLLGLTLSRGFLVICKWPRVAAVEGLWPVLVYGLRMDTLILSILLAPAALLVLLTPPGAESGRKARTLGWWLAGWAGFLAFMEAATPAFIDQYDARPNRLFIEYLGHPREVFSTLWAAYRLELILSLVLVTAVVWGTRRLVRIADPGRPSWSLGRRLAVLPLVLVLLGVGARSSFDHRPASPSTVAFSGDNLVNQLGLSSAYSVLHALYRLSKETDSGRWYGRMPAQEVFAEVNHHAGIPAALQLDPQQPSRHRQASSHRPDRPLNLVIILEESMGASFVGALGGAGVTPELERLAPEGLWFEQLYATGTRSAIGIEAVITGLPPTPARSVIKLGLAQRNFFNLGGLLRNQGYHTEFIYAGNSAFDNMRGFFLGNGFARVLDVEDFDNPVFENSWGVSDEDLFARLHQELLAHGDRPFFTLAFTVSNHSPYEFPEGRIELVEEPKGTAKNAVRYADYALGRFFDQARSAPYWENTIFLIVADHESKVFGDSLLPVKRFQIPGLILGATVKPGRITHVASQIDLAPTLLALLGIEAEHPMIGRNLLDLPPDWPGRAIMQFDNNHGYLQGTDVVIHQPGGLVSEFAFEGGELLPADVDSSVERLALAYALWPNLVYREQRYRLQ